MKLIFLHGLGQSADSWKEVQDFLADYPSEALELFPSGVASYQEAKERIYQHFVRGDRTFCLNRLILVLHLHWSFQVTIWQIFQALVLSGCPLKFSRQLSLFIFNL